MSDVRPLQANKANPTANQPRRIIIAVLNPDE
jgi:hypothetical protein